MLNRTSSACEDRVYADEAERVAEWIACIERALAPRSRRDLAQRTNAWRRTLGEVGTGPLARLVCVIEISNGEVERLRILLRVVPIAVSLGIETCEYRAFAVEVVATRRDSGANRPEDQLVETLGSVDVRDGDEHSVETCH
jgi:hypothetical protein